MSLEHLRRVSPPPSAPVEVLLRRLNLPATTDLYRLVREGYLHFSKAENPTGETAYLWELCDRSGRVRRVRRLAGSRLINDDGDAVESVVVGDPSWPIGASAMRSEADVVLVAGAEDFIAAESIWADGILLGAISTVAMVASVPIAEDALEFFAGKEVQLAYLDKYLLPEDQKTFEIWRNQLTRVASRVTRWGDGCPRLSLGDFVNHYSGAIRCALSPC